MRRVILLAGIVAGAIAMMQLAANQSTQGPPEAGDPSGVGTRPARLVSLSPGITEILFALGLGDRIVGITSHCVYPPEAAGIKQVGNWLATNAESVIALTPDLVVISSMESAVADHLTRLGMRCLVVKQDSIGDILTSIRDIGAACGAEVEARELSAGIQEQFRRIESAVAGQPRPRTLVAVGRDYTSRAMDQVYVAGKDSFYSELVRMAGGENAFAEGGFPYPAVSGEGIMLLNPEVILEMVPERATHGLDSGSLLAAWTSLPEVAAVKSGRVFVLDGDYMAIPGPRVVRALTDIARKLHPEAKL
ncbi:MAG: ABC transporter substrate-binding protein [Candidatus Hydrogenedentes bacterium]|nr:ABC transporter substrate-binding protein [Candidatus Hydrogenedentota bacterium]